MCTKMLAINPEERLTAEEVLEHPFFDEKPKTRNPNRKQPRAPVHAGGAVIPASSPRSVGSDSDPPPEEEKPKSKK